MASGIKPRALAPATSDRQDLTTVKAGIPFEFEVTVSTGTSSYTWKNHSSDSFKVTHCYGYMTQAGAAGDTAVVNRIDSAASTDAITDTADLSVFADTEQFDFSEVDDDYNTIRPGEQINITTASAPACIIYVAGLWMEA